MKHTRTRPWLLAPLALAAAACNSPAGAQNAPSTQGGPFARRDDAYVEGETCTRTVDCPRSAHCIAGACQPIARSYQGEVLTERGLRALAVGRYEDGAEAYRAAEQAYRMRTLPVPAVVTCGLARALTGVYDRGPSAGDTREAAARALAACLASAPPNSAMADGALASLAGLADRGLDPNALDRPGAALMTGRDPRPTAESTHVRITFTGTGDAASSHGVFAALVNGDPLHREVTRCFLQWWESSRQNSDQGTIRVAYSRGTDDYDELTAPTLTITPADITPTPADAGTGPHWLQCTGDALRAASAGLRWPSHSDHWNESVVISVGSS